MAAAAGLSTLAEEVEPMDFQDSALGVNLYGKMCMNIRKGMYAFGSADFSIRGSRFFILLLRGGVGECRPGYIFPKGETALGQICIEDVVEFVRLVRITSQPGLLTAYQKDLVQARAKLELDPKTPLECFTFNERTNYFIKKDPKADRDLIARHKPLFVPPHWIHLSDLLDQHPVGITVWIAHRVQLQVMEDHRGQEMKDRYGDPFRKVEVGDNTHRMFLYFYGKDDCNVCLMNFKKGTFIDLMNFTLQAPNASGAKRDRAKGDDNILRSLKYAPTKTKFAIIAADNAFMANNIPDSIPVAGRPKLAIVGTLAGGTVKFTHVTRCANCKRIYYNADVDAVCQKETCSGYQKKIVWEPGKDFAVEVIFDQCVLVEGEHTGPGSQIPFGEDKHFILTKDQVLPHLKPLYPDWLLDRLLRTDLAGFTPGGEQTLSKMINTWVVILSNEPNKDGAGILVRYTDIDYSSVKTMQKYYATHLEIPSDYTLRAAHANRAYQELAIEQGIDTPFVKGGGKLPTVPRPPI